MIIKNFGSLKNRNEESFGIIDKYGQRVFLKQGETCEVRDDEGKGYISNYWDVFCRVEVDEKNQGSRIEDLERQLRELKWQSTVEKVPEKDVISTTETIKVYNEQELEDMRKKYKEEFGTIVPPRYRNNPEWILAKLPK